MLSAESANFTLKNSPHLVRAGEFDRSVLIILAQIDQANLRASRSDSPGRAVAFRFWKIGRVMTNKVTGQPKCCPPREEGSERVRALVKELYPVAAAETQKSCIEGGQFFSLSLFGARKKGSQIYRDVDRISLGI